MTVTYIKHSGFLVETEHSYLLFDYWQGAIPPLSYEKDLYVFSSHVHRDHYTKDIFKLENKCNRVVYILSSDIKNASRFWKKAENVCFMNPYEEKTVGRCGIRTLKSTDEGVAFLVNTDGNTIYHAGDLHWWEWPGESDDYNEKMGALYREEIARIESEKIDCAFVVLDPRQEDSGTLGMDYFIKKVGAHYIFPMHCWEKYDMIKNYKEKNEYRFVTGQIMSITAPGQTFVLE